MDGIRGYASYSSNNIISYQPIKEDIFTAAERKEIKDKTMAIIKACQIKLSEQIAWNSIEQKVLSKVKTFSEAMEILDIVEKTIEQSGLISMPMWPWTTQAAVENSLAEKTLEILRNTYIDERAIVIPSI